MSTTKFGSPSVPSRFCGVLQDDESEAMRLVEGILGRKSFYFQQRTGKLDIRAIGRVDVDRVVKEVDIDTLQVGTFSPDAGVMSTFVFKWRYLCLLSFLSGGRTF